MLWRSWRFLNHFKAELARRELPSYTQAQIEQGYGNSLVDSVPQEYLELCKPGHQMKINSIDAQHSDGWDLTGLQHPR